MEREKMELIQLIVIGEIRDKEIRKSKKKGRY